jgi:hypothetical protein
MSNLSIGGTLKRRNKTSERINLVARYIATIVADLEFEWKYSLVVRPNVHATICHWLHSEAREVSLPIGAAKQLSIRIGNVVLVVLPLAMGRRQ